MEYESDSGVSSRYSHQEFAKGARRLGNKRTCGDYPNDSMIKNGQNTEKITEIEETCCQSNSSEKLSANTGVKTLNIVK